MLKFYVNFCLTRGTLSEQFVFHGIQSYGKVPYVLHHRFPVFRECYALVDVNI